VEKVIKIAPYKYVGTCPLSARLLSAFSRNRCPFSARTGVRFAQESVSVFSRVAVRFGHEIVCFLVKNIQVNNEVHI